MFQILSKDWQKYFDEKSLTLAEELVSEDEKRRTVFPKKEDRFNAFKYFKPSQTKVVIIGQDPYIQAGQAHGLSFSVPDETSLPPSLRNIYKELESDLKITRDTGNLSDWASQGVLLLNASLTVIEGLSNSHEEIWYDIMTAFLKNFSKENDCIYILWGNNAKALKKCISKGFFIEGTHPSPLSANRGGFFGLKYFSRCNKELENRGLGMIKW